MSVAVTWSLRAITAAACVLPFLVLPPPSTGQMPGMPPHMSSNPNDLGSTGESEAASSSKEDKKARKAEKKAEKERKRAEKERQKSGETARQSTETAPQGSSAAPPVAVPFTAVAPPPGANRLAVSPGRKICGEKPKPIIVGSNGKVGSGARAKGKALSTLSGLAGGFLGGGGGGGGKGKDGPPLVKCKIKDKEMTLFTDPGTGISMKVGAKQTGDTINVFAEVAKSPDNGTFQAAYMTPPGESPQVPQDVGICGLWGEWSLTVSWTKTTYVNGQKVSEESGGYSKAGNFSIPGTVSSDAAPAGLWKQMGFSNASHGAKGIAMQYKAPAALAAGKPVDMVIHVTRPGEDPVTTVPFVLKMSKVADNFMFEQAPDEPCPEDGGPQMATDDGPPANQQEEQQEEQEDDQPPPAAGPTPGSTPADPPKPPPVAQCLPGQVYIAYKDPCEERLRQARDRLAQRPSAGAATVDGLRDRAAQEARIAGDIATQASLAHHDAAEAGRKAEDARREAEFREGLFDKYGTHQQGQTAAYDELAEAARGMGDNMEQRAVEAERRADGWDEAAARYDKLTKTTSDRSLADAARQAADNAREEAAKYRDQANEYREEAAKDYKRSDERTQSGQDIQTDTDKMAKDAQDARQAADDAEALEECLKRAAAMLDRMAAAQAQAAQIAAGQLAQVLTANLKSFLANPSAGWDWEAMSPDERSAWLNDKVANWNTLNFDQRLAVLRLVEYADQRADYIREQAAYKAFQESDAGQGTTPDAIQSRSAQIQALMDEIKRLEEQYTRSDAEKARLKELRETVKSMTEKLQADLIARANAHNAMVDATRQLQRATWAVNPQAHAAEVADRVRRMAELKAQLQRAQAQREARQQALDAREAAINERIANAPDQAAADAAKTELKNLEEAREYYDKIDSSNVNTAQARYNDALFETSVDSHMDGLVEIGMESSLDARVDQYLQANPGPLQQAINANTATIRTGINALDFRPERFNVWRSAINAYDAVTGAASAAAVTGAAAVGLVYGVGKGAIGGLIDLGELIIIEPFDLAGEIYERQMGIEDGFFGKESLNTLSALTSQMPLETLVQITLHYGKKVYTGMQTLQSAYQTGSIVQGFQGGVPFGEFIGEIYVDPTVVIGGVGKIGKVLGVIGKVDDFMPPPGVIADALKAAGPGAENVQIVGKLPDGRPYIIALDSSKPGGVAGVAILDPGTAPLSSFDPPPSGIVDGGACKPPPSPGTAALAPFDVPPSGAVMSGPGTMALPEPAFIFWKGGTDLVLQTADGTKMINLGPQLGKGSYTVVFRNASQPGTVVKITQGGVSEFAQQMDRWGEQALNSLPQNIRDNVVSTPKTQEAFAIKAANDNHPFDGGTVRIVGEAPPTFMDQLGGSARMMTPEEAKALYEGTRAINDNGMVWLDNKFNNYGFQPNQAGGLKLAIQDPGGIVPIKGATPAERAQRALIFQTAVSNPPGVWRIRLKQAEDAWRKAANDLARAEGMQGGSARDAAVDAAKKALAQAEQNYKNIPFEYGDKLIEKYGDWIDTDKLGVPLDQIQGHFNPINGFMYPQSGVMLGNSLPPATLDGIKATMMP
ncbi:MAG: hypothetical protein AB7O49_14660 [Sphingomonadales bacterium]